MPIFSQVTFKKFIQFRKSVGKLFSFFWISRCKLHFKILFLIWPSLFCFNHRTKLFKVLFYKLSDAQLNYRSVDCFCTVLKFSFFESERMCNKRTTFEGPPGSCCIQPAV